jgi:lipopolysaccharide transport system permease protein
LNTTAETAEIRELVIGPETRFAWSDLRDVWDHRELLWILALRDVRVRYKQATLGVAWALLQPITQTILFTLLFNRIAGLGSDSSVPYPVFCLAGVVVWSLFASGLSHASESLIASSNLVTKVHFPRAVIPLATIVTAVVDFAIATALLLAAMAIFRTPIAVSAWLALPMALLAALLAASLGLWTSALNLRYRDIRHALPFFIQVCIYATPVFYSSSRIPARWQWLLYLNPMAAVVDGFRAALFGGELPWARIGLAALSTVILGALGFIWFRHTEQTFADRV